ncbi:F-box/LRR-repeat protein 7 isoform X2 [Eurytemora carolleeae]|uniref:F-box/LRR-repeat protein 7 isoform X2 n=1 Tax=Eurytemora carolleeae TaxID=1294199 RepID=UPI000C761E4B|nr:F-box/LRR-repeat protein 7 isoform X2 [Eurytemora carolleeae]|eukprot:XP_023326266.1 F-box/LRR-repeat protein 7-like isoform X2 [Eurytemora affinis]
MTQEFRGIVDLPSEIFLMIYQHLNQTDRIRLSVACKRMHELCLDPGLWTEFIIDCMALHQFSPQILSFATRMCEVESVKVTNKYMVKVSEQSIAELLLKFQTSLIKLEFSDEVEVTTRFIDKLRKMDKLESLELPGLSLTKTGYSSLSKLTRLQKLRIPSCTGSSEELINLLGNWNNLKLLDISDMEKGAVNTKVLSAVTKNNPNLESLIIDESDRVNNGCCKAISENCPNLLELSMYGCDGVTESGIVNLVKKCQKLRLLSLGNLRMLSCRAIKCIAELVDLEYLDV